MRLIPRGECWVLTVQYASGAERTFRYGNATEADEHGARALRDGAEQYTLQPGRWS